MVRINLTDDYFEYIKNNSVIKIIYGAGNIAKNNYSTFGDIDYFCDKNADSIIAIDNIKCILPKELEKMNDHLSILVCVSKEQVFDEICHELGTLNIDAEVFNLFHNPSFQWFQGNRPVYHEVPKDRLKIRIVYSEDGWIFGKFASKLEEELLKLGQAVSISNTPDLEADVNHFISYGYLQQFLQNYKGVYTTMVTHIDTAIKKELISFQAQHNALGICMSKDTMDKLTAWGVKREKLCFINPAQDGIIKPQKTVLGITNRCYAGEDLRKNDRMLLQICEQLDPAFFEIKIMGSGWQSIVSELLEMGFDVTYYSDFDRETYIKLIPGLDYWLYFGFDEGAMGYLDAMAAGVKTIVTPQGYHLDTRVKPTYLCSTVFDFTKVLKEIQEEKKEIVNSVADWTWDNYAKKHLEIWQYLTKSRPLKEIYKHQSEYMDGIFSMLLENNCV